MKSWSVAPGSPAKITPTTRPFESSSGPPELPCLIRLDTCMTLPPNAISPGSSDPSRYPIDAPGRERQLAAERVADGGHVLARLGIGPELGHRRQRRRDLGRADVDQPRGLGLVDVGVQRRPVPGVELQHRRTREHVPVGDDRVLVDAEARARRDPLAGDVAHAQRQPLGRATQRVLRELVRRALEGAPGDGRHGCDRRELVGLGLRDDAHAEHRAGAERRARARRARTARAAAPRQPPPALSSAAKSVCACWHDAPTLSALASTHAKSSAA